MNRVQIREKQTRKNPVLRKCFFKSNDIVEQRAEMLMFLGAFAVHFENIGN